MGQWTVFRLKNSDVLDITNNLTVDAAFGRMMELAATRWVIVSKPTGGYRLDMTRKGPVPDLPYADAETVADFWPRIESEFEDRRTAEREIKEDMLFRGRDGVQAQYTPAPGAGVVQLLAKRIGETGEPAHICDHFARASATIAALTASAGEYVMATGVSDRLWTLQELVEETSR